MLNLRLSGFDLLFFFNTTTVLKLYTFQSIAQQFMICVRNVG
jgi:hypothetical protein